MTDAEDGRRSPENVFRRVKTAWEGFKDFILRDSVLEVAVALIISQGFTRIVNSMVSDLLLPLVGLLPIFGRNLPAKFVVLRSGPNGPHYNTLQQAAEDGAVTLAYGSFIDTLTNFIALGLVLYLLAQTHDRFSKQAIIKHTTKCSYCRKDISEKARRCAFCTSWQDGTEEHRQTSAIPTQ